MKARRLEDPRNYILVEEITYISSHDPPGYKPRQGVAKCEKRSLADDECVYQAQLNWKHKSGKFMLTERAHAPEVIPSNSKMYYQ